MAVNVLIRIGFHITRWV